LIREALIAALSRPVATVAVALVTALTCATVLLTTGRAVRAQEDVVSRLDNMGTLLIAASDGQGLAGMMASSVTTVGSMPAVEWAFGLGAAKDGHNAALPGGEGVAARPFFGDLRSVVTLNTGRWPGPGEAIASTTAAAELGLIDGVGGIAYGSDDSDSHPIVGTYRADRVLKSLANSVLIEPTTWQAAPILYLYAKAIDVSWVDRVVDAVPSVITAATPAGITVESPQALRDARGQISSDLAASSRYLMLATLATGLVLVAVTMLAAVTDRKADFGRRRALGASRSAVIVVVMVQALVAALVGAAVGVGCAQVVNAVASASSPSLAFTVGLVVLAVACAVVAAVPPAILASLRDPVRVLRVP
jgi:putative ABC transport system permease protein